MSFISLFSSSCLLGLFIASSNNLSMASSFVVEPSIPVWMYLAFVIIFQTMVPSGKEMAVDELKLSFILIDFSSIV